MPEGVQGEGDTPSLMVRVQTGTATLESNAGNPPETKNKSPIWSLAYVQNTGHPTPQTLAQPGPLMPDSQDLEMETTSVSFNQGIDNESVVHIRKGMLFNYKEKGKKMQVNG